MKHPSRDTSAASRAATRIVALAAAGTLACAWSVATAAAQPSQDVDSLRDVTVDDLAATLGGSGVSVESATFDGIDVQAGIYRDMALGAITPASGVVLSSGSVVHADPQSDDDVDFTSSAVLGPNTKLTTSGDLGGSGSAVLEELFGSTTYDAAVLTLEVVPEGDDLNVEYVFGSEEHAVWAEQDFEDAFAILVDGEICSTVPGTQDPVSTATVNASTNAELHVVNFGENDPAAGEHHTEMNGFTVPLTCEAQVTAGEPSTVVVAVADTVDGQLDSSVLLSAQSLTSTPAEDPDPTPTPTPDPTPTTDPKPTPDPTTSTDPAPGHGGPGAGPGGGKQLPWTGVDPAGLMALGAALLLVGSASWLVARRLRASVPGSLLE
ncbi:MAG: choice-of-anchor L domain-containing protein [Pauljensenia sp.]